MYQKPSLCIRQCQRQELPTANGERGSFSLLRENFGLGEGQRPQKGSDRAGELEEVEKCPKHMNPGLIDPLGKRIQCLCGYHQQQVSQMHAHYKNY